MEGSTRVGQKMEVAQVARVAGGDTRLALSERRLHTSGQGSDLRIHGR